MAGEANSMGKEANERFSNAKESTQLSHSVTKFVSANYWIFLSNQIQIKVKKDLNLGPLKNANEPIWKEGALALGYVEL